MPPDTDPNEDATPGPEPAGGPIRVTEDAARLVERMCDELGLWRTRTEAALFLAALAAARDAEPVDAGRLDELTEIGTTDEIDGAREGLAVLGLLDEAAHEPGAVRRERLPGWIEAGAGILGPRLAGSDVAQATAEVAAVLDEMGGASS